MNDLRSRDELQNDYAAQTAEAAERLKASLSLATSGLQYLTAVNGGAMIALFTLIGSGKVKFDMSGLWIAFAFFAAGIVFSLSAYLFGHLAQDQFYLAAQSHAWNAQAILAGRAPVYDELKHKTRGSRLLIAAVSVAVLSLVGFIIGASATFASVS